MWRWSSINIRTHLLSTVFSTYVEVILNKFLENMNTQSILHVCGGDPTLLLLNLATLKYSPSMWRWSYSWIFRYEPTGVFSKYVEVILKEFKKLHPRKGILQVCGGDPNAAPIRSSQAKYSPSMWRWSWAFLTADYVTLVFSTWVEVKLYGERYVYKARI